MELGAGVEDVEDEEEEEAGVDAEGQGEVDEEEAGVTRGEEVRREGARPGVEDEEIKIKAQKVLQPSHPHRTKTCARALSVPCFIEKNFLVLKAHLRPCFALHCCRRRLLRNQIRRRGLLLDKPTLSISSSFLPLPNGVVLFALERAEPHALPALSALVPRERVVPPEGDAYEPTVALWSAGVGDGD